MPAQIVVNSFPNGVDYTQRSEILSGQIVLSGTYVTGGIPLNWLTATNGSVTGSKHLPSSNDSKPYKVWLASAGTTGFEYLWNKTNNTLQIYQNAAVSGPATELPNATALPTEIADIIQYEAWFSAAI